MYGIQLVPNTEVTVSQVLTTPTNTCTACNFEVTGDLVSPLITLWLPHNSARAWSIISYSNRGMSMQEDVDFALSDWSQSLVDLTTSSSLGANDRKSIRNDSAANLSVRVAVGCKVFVKVDVGEKHFNEYKILLGIDSYARRDNTRREGYNEIDDEEIIGDNDNQQRRNVDDVVERKKTLLLTGKIVRCNWKNTKVSIHNLSIFFLRMSASGSNDLLFYVIQIAFCNIRFSFILI